MSEKKLRVMGFGTFDGIHAGHLEYLKQLQELGDEVFLVVSRDGNVEKIKGRLPQNDETERVAALERLNVVTKVVLGDESDFYLVLDEFKPDVIGLGYDQKANEDEIKKRLPNAKLMRLKGYKPEKFKSSLMNGSN